MADFSKYKVKEYKYWDVSVHENQGYLGRCVVWCKREDALDLTDATDEEREELFEILRELRAALTAAFQPDWLNYAFLGNETRHVHCHVIPRYEKQKVFEGVTFEDRQYGHNYQTDHDFVTPGHIIESVKNKLGGLL